MPKLLHQLNVDAHLASTTEWGDYEQRKGTVTVTWAADTVREGIKKKIGTKPQEEKNRSSGTLTESVDHSDQ